MQKLEDANVCTHTHTEKTVICKIENVKIDPSPRRIFCRLLQPRNEPLSTGSPERPYALHQPSCDFLKSSAD